MLYPTKIIGGEFELNPYSFQKKSQNIFDGFFYSSGRAALYAILDHIFQASPIKTIYLPNYLCSSVVETTRLFRTNIIFYPILDNLKPDESFLQNQDFNLSIIILINYFGCIDLQSIIHNLKRNNTDLYIVEDNVQALHSMFTETEANFSFTSFRKQLPVPDGGWVKTKHENFNSRQINKKNTFVSYKIAGGLLKNYKYYKCIDDSVYLDLLNKGEKLINDNLYSTISDFTLDIISKLDLNSIAQKRTENALYLLSKLDKIGIKPLVEIRKSFIPLFLPIMLKNRDQVKDILFQHSIFCPTHWPTDNISELNKLNIMANSELSLVIDQRYDFKDMDMILKILEQYGEPN